MGGYCKVSWLPAGTGGVGHTGGGADCGVCHPHCAGAFDGTAFGGGTDRVCGKTEAAFFL